MTNAATISHYRHKIATLENDIANAGPDRSFIEQAEEEIARLEDELSALTGGQS